MEENCKTAKSRPPLTPNPAAQAHRRARESRRWRRPPSSAQIRAGAGSTAAERSGSGVQLWGARMDFVRNIRLLSRVVLRCPNPPDENPSLSPRSTLDRSCEPAIAPRNGQFADRHPHPTGKGLVQDSDGATRRPSLVRDSYEMPRLGRHAETRTRRDATPRTRTQSAPLPTYTPHGRAVPQSSVPTVEDRWRRGRRRAERQLGGAGGGVAGQRRGVRLLRRRRRVGNGRLPPQPLQGSHTHARTHARARACTHAGFLCISIS